jgi:hypothetical protein
LSCVFFPWLEINFDDLVQKKIEAPWKPELMSFESEPISGAFSLQAEEEDYESTEDWLDNICKRVAGWIVYVFLSCVRLWSQRRQRSNVPSSMCFCSFLFVSRIRVGETSLQLYKMQ